METGMLKRDGQTKKKVELRVMSRQHTLRTGHRLQEEPDLPLPVIREGSKHQAISMDNQVDQSSLPKLAQ
jgi:hypothetical protein